ncbi:MAG: YihA family ribosome biogenesis GTP-binding protein [Bacteroidaceae bacterium]|nr:YihA family ribosome biogenesis GTP-binding protein [Bacteroidaceae bacterium]
MIIRSAEFVISNARAEACPRHSLPEYAFIGRSNVGKSSLINCLTGRKGLAKTSATPGKTLLINHFIINGEWYIVDLPGYGYAKRSKKQQEELRRIIDHYIALREELTCLFVLIDSRIPPQTIDLDFIRRAGAAGVPLAVVFTKADGLSKTKLELNIKRFLDALREDWEEIPPYFVTSSTKRVGTDELLDYIDGINNELQGAGK